MIRYEQVKGRRIMGGKIKSPAGRKYSIFWQATTFDSYWWVDAENRWVHEDVATGGRSTHCPIRIRSVRAFRRRLREWSRYLPKGVEFILVSQFPHCVTGRTTG